MFVWRHLMICNRMFFVHLISTRLPSCNSPALVWGRDRFSVVADAGGTTRHASLENLPLPPRSDAPFIFGETSPRVPNSSPRLPASLVAWRRQAAGSFAFLTCCQMLCEKRVPEILNFLSLPLSFNWIFFNPFFPFPCILAIWFLKPLLFFSLFYTDFPFFLVCPGGASNWTFISISIGYEVISWNHVTYSHLMEPCHL